MIKELIIALSFGAILGFFLTGGFYVVTNRQRPQTNQVTITPISNSDFSPTPASQDTLATITSELTITSPKNEAVTIDSTIDITGTASPKSHIIAITPNKIYTATTSAGGQFTLTLDLEGGPNPIKITAVDGDDNQFSKDIIVTYSTAKI